MVVAIEVKTTELWWWRGGRRNSRVVVLVVGEVKCQAGVHLIFQTQGRVFRQNIQTSWSGLKKFGCTSTHVSVFGYLDETLFLCVWYITCLIEWVFVFLVDPRRLPGDPQCCTDSRASGASYGTSQWNIPGQLRGGLDETNCQAWTDGRNQINGN